MAVASKFNGFQMSFFLLLKCIEVQIKGPGFTMIELNKTLNIVTRKILICSDV